MSASLSDREIVNTRLLNAPRELVYKAWIQPEHLAIWWGPNGFTNTFHTFEPRPGGAWKFVMHGPDGTNYKNENVFEELAPSERVVVRHVSWPHFQLTATFTEEAGKTRILWRQLFDKAEDCAKVKGFAADANEQNLDRLEAELARMG